MKNTESAANEDVVQIAGERTSARADMTQLKTPDARRPQASEIHEQKNRPSDRRDATQITSFEASAG